MNILGPNDCIFSGLDNIFFLSTPSLRSYVKEDFLLELGSVQKLHQCLRGGWGVRAHSLIPLMLLGVGGGSKVKKLMSFLNMFSPDIVV